jgi:ribosomal peptide maturation radical SAM protein 1
VLPRTLLIQMPWASVQRPALGVSLLKAVLTAEGLPADIQYFNLLWLRVVLDALGLPGTAAAMAALSPVDEELVFQGARNPAMADEWIFAKELFGERLPDVTAFRQRFRSQQYPVGESYLDRTIALQPCVRSFIEQCIDSVEWDRYDLVGFTSTFRQHCASLLLAREIKTRYPKIDIVFGGANCEGPMGRALLRCFDFVDYVAAGEADHSLPALVRCIGARREPAGVPGVFWRDGRSAVIAEPPRLETNLDALPTPDFSDYFSQLNAHGAGALFETRVALEQSRGCWWGQRQHCTFCGLNGQAMQYRRKSPTRAMQELMQVRDRYGVTGVDFADTILDFSYFDSLLPALAAADHGMSLFYEVKANVRRKQVAALRAAGVTRVQPGIESLSTPVLSLMRKGCTMLQNVQCLKWFFQYGVRTEWNVLYGFPGETAADYEWTLNVLKSITHLHPPFGCCRISLHRFSPNFERRSDLGFRNIRPAEPYKYLYPLSDEELFDLAYTFEYDYADERQPEAYTREVRQFVQEWQAYEARRGRLVHVSLADGRGLIDDNRFNVTPACEELSPAENLLYTACDEARSISQLQLAVPLLSADQIEEVLERFVARRWMVREGGRYLAVAPVSATAAEMFDRSLHWLPLLT